MKFILAYILIAITGFHASAQKDKFLTDLLSKSSHPVVQRVLKSQDKFHTQLIYEEIKRDKKGRPHFKRHTFRFDPELYFYPASTIKMANAVLALEKLNDLGLAPELTFHTDSARYPQKRVTVDTTAKNGIPTITHYIEMIFAISDNEASNRLYEFIGMEELHERLRRRGYDNTRINNRLADFRFTTADNLYTNPVYLLEGNDTVYRQPERHAALLPPLDLNLVKRGKGYLDQNDSLIHAPFDFSKKNFFPLDEQLDMVKAIMFPEALPPQARFNLDDHSYQVLRTTMHSLPRHYRYPVFDTTEYYDSYCKFFLFGDSHKPIPDHIHIYNKVGWAYGFLTDVAYIADYINHVEFLLAGTLEVNPDEIYNDNQYEYETIGKPFLAEVGRIIHAYEKSKKRKPRIIKIIN